MNGSIVRLRLRRFPHYDCQFYLKADDKFLFFQNFALLFFLHIEFKIDDLFQNIIKTSNKSLFSLFQ